MGDLIQRLREGYIVKPKRWSGDTHSDSATGEVDAEATDALMVEAADEIERLQATVDWLPKTADGVPIMPGMYLWYAHTSPIDRERCVYGVRCVNVDSRVAHMVGGQDTTTHTFYSTQAAAEAA